MKVGRLQSISVLLTHIDIFGAFDKNENKLKYLHLVFQLVHLYHLLVNIYYLQFLLKVRAF